MMYSCILQYYYPVCHFFEIQNLCQIAVKGCDVYFCDFRNCCFDFRQFLFFSTFLKDFILWFRNYIQCQSSNSDEISCDFSTLQYLNMISSKGSTLTRLLRGCATISSRAITSTGVSNGWIFSSVSHWNEHYLLTNHSKKIWHLPGGLQIVRTLQSVGR